MFNAGSMGEAVGDICGMLALRNIPLVSSEALYYLKSYITVFAVSIIGATPLPKLAAEKCRSFSERVEPVLLLSGLLISTAYLVDGSFNPFLYFRF